MALTFIEEDGTGLNTSTSYASIAGFKQYWTDRNIDYSALTDTVIKALLNRATEYIDNYYSFQGYVKSTTQALQFPRTSIYNKNNVLVSSSIVPTQVKSATYEVAREIYITDTNNGEYTNANYQGQGIKSKSIGVMSITYANNSGENGTTFKSYPNATNYLSPFLNQGVRC